MSVERLEAAVGVLVRPQRLWMMRTFGYMHAAVDGWHNHNLTHTVNVAERAAAGARLLVASGDLPRDTPALARLAGYYHDRVQLPEHADPGHRTTRSACAARLLTRELSPQREELSAQAAIAAMRDYNKRSGEEVFTASRCATVEEMIDATKVVGRTGTKLVQNASPDRLERALLADADLSQFGRLDGVWQSLAFHGETEWLQGDVAPSVNGSLRTLPLQSLVPRTAAFLTDQRMLFRDHEYLLEQTRKLFPHQKLNSRRVGILHSELMAGRLDWPGMVDRAGVWAREASSRQIDGLGKALPGERRIMYTRRDRDDRRHAARDVGARG